MNRLMLITALLVSASMLWPQTGMETTRSHRIGPVEWPSGPSRDSLPTWAKPGAIRFARWDGGRIETAKAMLSGWPGFNPPDPDRVFTMTNWYDPSTVRLLREAGINTIWVTFSNGFSCETEKAHQDELRLYIDECHRSGIHVMAYESIQNMFWDDMYEHVPQSRNWALIGKDGKPTPYSAADYSKMGRVTRHMADLAKPEWLAYLRHRVDLALDAGADGIIYDNNASNYLLDTYREIYQYGSSRKKDFLLMGNFHSDTYVYNRIINCITTEDGIEPGIYTEHNADNAQIAAERATLLPFDGGFLVNNAGLFRVQSALSEGWKPVMVEDGHREVGQRETTPMSPERHKLALAEGMMLGVGMELFVEGAFAHGLATKDPATMEIWRAIGAYNSFFADNQEYYTGTESLAPLAIVLDDRSAGVALLNGLAARGVVFDVLYERDLTPEKLARYSGVALLSAETVRDRALAALESYAQKGGKLFLAANAAVIDEKGNARPRPALFAKAVCFPSPPSVDEVAAALGAIRSSVVQVEAPRGVLYNVVAQSEAGRVLVHLLNYSPRPAANIKITVPGKFQIARLLSPDSPRAAVRVSGTGIELPELRTYSLLVLELRPEH